jgi:hypothetical protein
LCTIGKINTETDLKEKKDRQTRDEGRTTYRCASRGGSGRGESTRGRHYYIQNVTILEDCGCLSRIKLDDKADIGIHSIDCCRAGGTNQCLELGGVARLTLEINRTETGTAGAYADLTFKVGQTRLCVATRADCLSNISAAQLARLTHGWACLADLVGVCIKAIRASSQALLLVQILIRLTGKISLA